MNRLIGGLVVSGLLLTSAAALAEDEQALIDRARSAAPSMVSADATVMYQGKVLAEGTNGWTCLPETMPGDNIPICNDAMWMEMFQAVGGKAPFEAKQMGFSYMLGGDGGVSNSDPYHPDPKNAEDFIKEGPHLMVIVPKSALEGITTDPHAGGPYVMWKDTPYAHIMIPVGERE
ncbi:hypothetical protein GCM10011352_39270 [Marinobacterium zhoushanense]|uniref:Uncharacterized protein n=1 Tax=Marinobacterium zhoushanense TaxID=1679163 RepID=A0ABQ1KUY9_9GAMM|nr:hypothetical protein [Marinobacterium zhoushanense]GGC09037.1 hypothetical protein GCM10011352_39270 [Marinobacterium zhoushanense]